MGGFLGFQFLTGAKARMRSILAAWIMTVWVSAFPLSGTAGFLNYDAREKFVSTATLVFSDAERRVFEVRMPSARRGFYASNDTIWGRFYVPARGRGPWPAVILLPVLAAPNTWIEERFVDALLSGGSAVFLVELPFQFHRLPRDPRYPSGITGLHTGPLFFGRSPQSLAAHAEQAVLDVRRARTWLGRRPEVDGRRVGLLGVSLGAIVGSVVFVVDDRFQAGAFFLGGADFADLIQHSAMTRGVVDRLRLSPEELSRHLRPFDPRLYRGSGDSRPVLLINAWFDRVVPRANARKLKEAFPRAGQKWIPFGHYTSILAIFWVRQSAARFFSGHL
ncbi:MAG: hypothetical protein A3G41_08240 [Elusimicrobia bacterium RIFCSPLOWO2_12_FULL_59_9]|nr:MAG: hypothetical protein A3G41_08240 [Elusimicrobia bacterium RIFCSPLOWO2_12_FULL_59_9]